MEGGKNKKEKIKWKGKKVGRKEIGKGKQSRRRERLNDL